MYMRVYHIFSTIIWRVQGVVSAVKPIIHLVGTGTSEVCWALNFQHFDPIEPRRRRIFHRGAHVVRSVVGYCAPKYKWCCIYTVTHGERETLSRSLSCSRT